MDNEKLFINRHISQIYRLSRRFFAKKLESYDFDVGQFPFLFLLFEKEGVTQEYLSADLGMDKGTTARSLALLEEKGLIFRKSDKSDRRINHVFLTSKARGMEDELLKIKKALRDAQFEGFSQQERELAQQFIMRIRDNMNKALLNE